MDALYFTTGVFCRFLRLFCIIFSSPYFLSLSHTCYIPPRPIDKRSWMRCTPYLYQAWEIVWSSPCINIVASHNWIVWSPDPSVLHLASGHITPQLWLIRISLSAFLRLLCCIITIVTSEYVWVFPSSSVCIAWVPGSFLWLFLQVPTGTLETTELQFVRLNRSQSRWWTPSTMNSTACLLMTFRFFALVFDPYWDQAAIALGRTLSSGWLSYVQVRLTQLYSWLWLGRIIAIE